MTAAELVMKRPLELCVNGDGRPVQPPSWVLCASCFGELDRRMRELGRRLGIDDDAEAQARADAAQDEREYEREISKGPWPR